MSIDELVKNPAISFVQIGESNAEKLQKILKKKDWDATISLGGEHVTLELNHDGSVEHNHFEGDDIEDVCDYALMDINEALEDE